AVCLVHEANDRPQVGYLQLKLSLASTLPLPSQCAVCGYGHSGRVMTTPFAGSSSTYFVATICFGATPSSTHFSSANSVSWPASAGGRGPRLPKEFGPGPKPQWSTPGARNKR